MPKTKGNCVNENSSIQTRSQVSRKTSLHSNRTMEISEMNSCLPNTEVRPITPSFRSVANITISPVSKRIRGDEEYSDLESDNVFLHSDSPLYSSKLNLSVGAHNSQYLINNQSPSKGSNGTMARDNFRSLCTSFSDLSIHDNQNSQSSSKLTSIHQSKSGMSFSNASGTLLSITSTPTPTQPDGNQP